MKNGLAYKVIIQFIFYVVGCNIDNFCLSYAFASMVVMGVQTTLP